MQGKNEIQFNSLIPRPDSKQSALYLIQYLLNVYYDIEKKTRSYPITSCEAVGMKSEPEEFKKMHSKKCNCISFDQLFCLAQFQIKLIGLKSQVFDDCNTSKKLFDFLCEFNYISVCGNIQDLNNAKVIDAKNFINRVRFTEIDFEHLEDYSRDKFVTVVNIDIIRLLCIYLVIEEYNSDVFHGLLYLLGNYGHTNKETELFLSKDYIQGNYLYVSGETSIGKALYRCVHCFIKSGFYSRGKANGDIISTVYSRISYQA